jgi:branched-chain amino acid transport system permease protein
MILDNRLQHLRGWVTFRPPMALLGDARPAKLLGYALVTAVVAFLIVWVLFIASGTSFGPAVSDPKDFLITLLNGITAAALYFVVASGFTLIFGLMRVVNMAHGAFFLLGGYIALKLQRHWVGSGGALGLSSSQVSLGHWLLPAIIAALAVGVLGLLVQQLFLRWNQGQELRQALITIAIAIILADQMLSHFGGIAEDIAWPGTFDKFVNLHVAGVQYTLTRLVILAIGIVIGGALWFWLKRTRTGMVIRAGVDDRAMVSAMGINIQLTFAVAFFVGSALAGLGGAVGGSFASLAPGVDANWLLNSLIVVIIGGMGSLEGAAIGALLLGLVTNFSAAYLPADYTFYAIIFTFVLLAVVLAVRPLGIFGRPA